MTPPTFWIIGIFVFCLVSFVLIKRYFLYRRHLLAEEQYFDILLNYHNTIPLFLLAYKKHIHQKDFTHLWKAHNVLHLLQSHLRRDNTQEMLSFLDNIDTLLDALSKKKAFAQNGQFQLLKTDLEHQHEKIRNGAQLLEIEHYLKQHNVLLPK